MNKARLFAMVLCLAALLILVLLSIYAAFIGADRAGDMFRSPLMLVFWILLAAALAASLLRFMRGRARIGSFCMHMGALLIVLGGFWGSERVHLALSRLAGASNAYDGYMALFPGVECDVLYAQDMRTEKGRLPFRLRLESFDIERYEPENTEWLLWVETIRGAGDDETSSMRSLEWAPGRTMRIPGVDASLTVLDYIERARPVSAGAPELEAEPDAGSDVPAMRIRLVCGGHEGESWLVPAHGQTRAGLTVGLPDSGQAGEASRLNFYLTAPEGEARSYKSDVSVLESGKEATRKTIMVNSPLSHGGYHVYQHSYDSRDMAYTVLYARSARGLRVVFAGFLFLCAGAAWWGAGVFAKCSTRSQFTVHGSQLSDI